MMPYIIKLDRENYNCPNLKQIFIDKKHKQNISLC